LSPYLAEGQVSFITDGLFMPATQIRAATPAVVRGPFADGDNHYRPYRTPREGIHIVDEKLCRKLPNGNPDLVTRTCFPPSGRRGTDGVANWKSTIRNGREALPPASPRF